MASCARDLSGKSVNFFLARFPGLYMYSCIDFVTLVNSSGEKLIILQFWPDFSTSRFVLILLYCLVNSSGEKYSITFLPNFLASTAVMIFLYSKYIWQKS